MSKFSAILIAVFIILPGLAIAETTDTKNESSKIQNGSASQNNCSDYCADFKFSGYIDGSYNYLVKSNQFTSGTFNRVFDIERHGLTLHQLALTIANQPKQGFGGLLNVIVGRDANTTAAYGWRPKWVSRSLATDPLQAYFQESIGTLTIIGGKFVTLAGFEVVDPTQDTNFSRSILWGYAEPTTHLGFRGTYAVNDKFNLIAGVNNGWDNLKDTSRHKTLEIGANYTFSPLFSLAAVGYSGGQRATDKTSDGPKGTRNLIDIIATINATEKLTFVANFDYGTQSIASLPDDIEARAIWVGIAGYINYKFNDCWRTSIRGEIFDDKDGYRTGVHQTWKEMTLTLGYAPCKNIEFKAEIRRDFSNVRSFVNADGEGTSRNQQSFALEAFYKFP